MTTPDIPDVLVRALDRHNPWWTEDSSAFAERLPARQKSDFYHLVRPEEPSSQFDESRVVGLVGRHGVGKTTLVKQFVHHQLSTGVEPERFLYLPFDANALYQLHSPEQFQRALRYYEGRVLGRLENPTPHYLLLDDVHRIAHRDKPGVDGWGTLVRDAVESVDGRRVVVTAGATEQVTAELERSGLSSEVSDVQPILPEKYRDYIYTRYPDIEDGETRVSPTPVRAGDGSLPHALRNETAEGLIETLRDQHDRVENMAPRIQSEVADYLTLGGVLSYVADGTKVDATTVCDSDYQLLYRNLTATLYQDAPSLESLRTVADLERLCALAAHNRGAEPIRFQRLVELFDVDRRTIRDTYLSVLSKLFVLTGVTEYDNQRPRAVRLYLRDSGLVSALTSVTPEEIRNDRDFEGDLARLAAFDHTMRLSYGINAAQNDARTPTVQYWRGRSGEVDFVFEVGETPVPVALAYHASTRHECIRTLNEFRETYAGPLGILLTSETGLQSDAVTEIEPGLIELPYWLYLMLC